MTNRDSWALFDMLREFNPYKQEENKMKFEVGETYKTRGTGGLVKLITRLENGRDVLVWNEVGTDGIYQTNEDGGFYSDGDPSKFDVMTPKRSGELAVYEERGLLAVSWKPCDVPAEKIIARVQWEEGQGL